MNDCHCSGNNSLRQSIGSVRCECGGRLNEAQTMHRVIDRLNELDEEIFRMIGALQVLGADKCDLCGEWAKDCWCSHDHCLCQRCLEGYPERPLEDEDLDEIQRFLNKRNPEL